MITIEKLTKTFEKVNALDGLSLSVKKGEFVGLIGPNGAGKTTLFKTIMGLVQPDSGVITINGQRLDENPAEFKTIIGYSPEPPLLYDYLTGREFLEFIGRIHNMPSEKVSAGINRLMQDLELTDKADDLIADYSHGMKKKVSLAAAILTGPELLLLDESTSGMDPESIYKVKSILKSLHKDKGTTIIFSSHILETVEKLCDRVAIIHHGRIVLNEAMRDLQASAAGKSLEEVFISIIQPGNESF